MADRLEWKGRSFSRRQFLTLAGIGAVVGAFILAATKKNGIGGLLKSTSGGQTQSNPATAGKFIQTSAQPAGPSWFERFLGGKL